MSAPDKIPTSSLPDELHSVTVAHLKDPTAVRDSITVLNYDMISLDPGSFAITRITVPFGNCTLVYIGTTAPIRTRTRSHKGYEGIFNVGPNGRGTIDGISAGPHALLALSSNLSVEVVVEARYESLGLLLPIGTVERHLTVRNLQNNFSIPHKFKLWQPDEQSAHAHFKLGKQMVRVAEEAPGLFNDSASARMGAGIEYLESLLDTIETCTSKIESESDKVGRNYSQIVKTCEEYTLTNNICRPYLSELCEATGVSRKTLHNAFHHIMGMSPMAYLNRLRLHRSRDDLRVASRGSSTVTDVALRWGFWHLGVDNTRYSRQS